MKMELSLTQSATETEVVGISVNIFGEVVYFLGSPPYWYSPEKGEPTRSRLPFFRGIPN
jgi:hypothetical protein